MLILLIITAGCLASLVPGMIVAAMPAIEVRFASPVLMVAAQRRMSFIMVVKEILSELVAWRILVVIPVMCRQPAVELAPQEATGGVRIAARNF